MSETLSHVWLFNINRRVYPPATKGSLSGGPIYREHWQQHKITGQTRVSWVTEHGVKVPKKGGPGIAFTLAEVEDAVWVHDHRNKLARFIERIQDAALLRKVADAAGYKPDDAPATPRQPIPPPAPAAPDSLEVAPPRIELGFSV